MDSPQELLDHFDEFVAHQIVKLDETSRRVLLLRAIGEFKYREIAEILDIPIGTVMGLLTLSYHRLDYYFVNRAQSPSESTNKSKL